MLQCNYLLILSLIKFALVLTYGRDGFGPGNQDWGYVDVREGAHIFWWLYETTAEDAATSADKPLVIWLQGGPGASSTGYGNFAEIGPLDVDLNERNTTWVKNYNVLFVDNPVGTGFSYADANKYLTTTNRQIADDFLALIQGFYQAQPDLRRAPLYIFSESYGGKMTAEIALVLNKAIENGDLEANLLGVGLGDSWISPIDSTLTWGPYLLSVGAVDQAGYEKIQEAANQVKEAIDDEKFSLATDLWGNTEGVIAEATSNIDFYNILTKIPGSDQGRFKSKIHKPSIRDSDDDKIEIMMNEQVKAALNLSVEWGAQSGAVFSALGEDFMKPVTDIVETLLNETDVIVAVYNGQLDLIVDTPGTVDWVDRLRWDGLSDWKDTERNTIVVDGIIEGYVKKLGNLGLYWVNRAGHMVPADNPAATSYILQDVIKGYSKKLN